MSKKKTRLSEARKQAITGTIDVKKIGAREFRQDLLKHYIRLRCWMPRVKKLIRAKSIDKIRYLSLCAPEALDARLFTREKLIDPIKDAPAPFVYCESDKENYEILKDSYPDSAVGFHGKIEEIGTDTDNADYGTFWGTFPLDVINLDFWGDIHKVKDKVKNPFRAIKAIVARQADLRDHYELWITWRAKPDRVANDIENAYMKMIDSNIDKNTKFKKGFGRSYSNKSSADLDVEELVRVGFMKWILYCANSEFSVVDSRNTEVLIYSRKDKDGKTYRLYNFLIRIKPYETVTIPSPACEAATFCEDKNQKAVSLCFAQPRDIDEEYSKLRVREKTVLADDLKQLLEGFNKDKSGILR